MAHELWHIVEHNFEARDHRAAMELRKRVGQWFGVETLEHAVAGGGRGAPPAWREAHRRLRSEVSGYATKTISEATAELFEGWCLVHEPRGAFAAFGAALDELLPSPRGVSGGR